MESTVNPDLHQERQNATIDTEALASILYQGTAKLQRRRHLIHLVESDPELQGPDLSFLSRDELYNESIRKWTVFLRKLKEWGLQGMDSASERMPMIMSVFPAHSSGLIMHEIAFAPPIEMLASEEQKAKWLPLIKNYKMIGCYAQTELGHGSHVRGLETTATYDPVTEEFVLNTPSVSATKWWVGNLGKSVNHAMVMAQLYTKGACLGMHPFLVQLRSMENHEPLPGITVGDIGPKFGFGGNDNGFLVLNNVRIPRENLLMGLSVVTRSGDYEINGDPKLLYGSMVGIRAGLAKASGTSAAMGATVAIRYSCVRRQSEMTPGEKEPQILDYQAQQHKLFPALAAAYAMWFTGDVVGHLYLKTMDEIKEGRMESLAELHGLTAGMKAYGTLTASRCVETCRLACGGHGYSAASGLGQLYADTVGGVTAEGEATVLYFQTARYLTKQLAAAKSGQQLAPTCRYLKSPQTRPLSAGNLSAASLVAAVQSRAARLLEKVGGKLQHLQNKGQNQREAWFQSQIALAKAAEAHCFAFTLEGFAKKLQQISDVRINTVLTDLCMLYGLHEICEKSGDFLEFGIVDSSSLSSLQDKYTGLLKAIRVNAVALVDAFDFTDNALNSVLGRYDGKVYENMYKWAQNSRLNRTQVADSYYKYLGPMIKSKM